MRLNWIDKKKKNASKNVVKFQYAIPAIMTSANDLSFRFTRAEHIKKSLQTFDDKLIFWSIIGNYQWTIQWKIISIAPRLHSYCVWICLEMQRGLFGWFASRIKCEKKMILKAKRTNIAVLICKWKRKKKCARFEKLEPIDALNEECYIYSIRYW